MLPWTVDRRVLSCSIAAEEGLAHEFILLASQGGFIEFRWVCFARLAQSVCVEIARNCHRSFVQTSVLSWPTFAYVICFPTVSPTIKSMVHTIRSSVSIAIKRVTTALWSLKCPKVAIFKAGLSVATTANYAQELQFADFNRYLLLWCFLHNMRWLVKILQLTA